jgi:hypothetical protein
LIKPTIKYIIKKSEDNNSMTEMILDIQTLPETISSKITTKKVKLYEENGTITLTPFSEERPRFDHLIGMFSDGKISIDDFLEEKQQEKKLEI